jgi:U32 family peptidase
MKEKPKYELLAPVGNFPMLVAAVKAGADAVYFGLSNGLNMRANAKSFSISDLKKIREICNSSPRKPKIYLTLNTIIYDGELKKLELTIKKVKGKVDAIICWDPSAIQLCKKYKIPFHISTQASISNTKSAEFYKNLGAKRIVLARELNLKQIKRISKIIDVEAFTHGAMCVAISGRCFTSQFLFNRSANRGQCIHPCRRSYIIKDKQEGYELELENNKVMSAKDLCMLPYIEEMKKAGITSFKIEGRNRDPRYVDKVIRTYRKALDKKLTKEQIKNLMKDLEKVYNRKFSSGFYLGLPTPRDFSDVEHSASSKKKIFVGKIKNYLKNIGVAIISTKEDLEVGNELCVIGKTTGIENFSLESLEVKKHKRTSTKKGEEVAIKMPLARKNDEIYKIVKTKNYSSGY